MHAAHKFTSLHFLWLSKFSFFKVYSYLSIVHISIFFCEIYRKIFLKCVFRLSLSWFSISKSGFLHLNFIGLLQCNKILSVINSMDWERIIRAGKPPQYFEFGPSSQDPFSFCQIQLTLNTVWCTVKNNFLRWVASFFSDCRSSLSFVISILLTSISML